VVVTKANGQRTRGGGGGRWRPRWRGAGPLLLALTLAAHLCGRARAAPDGQQLYDDACASCHGLDGKGAPTGTAIGGPLPDFTDGRVATSEPEPNWEALVAHGGRFLGLSPQMPAFADVLSADEIKAVLAYIRSFCPNPAWPRGDLNFPRAVFVTKAFPEAEAVVAPFFTQQTGARIYSLGLSVEARIGPRAQVELSVPLQLNDQQPGPTVGGFGDLALAAQYVVFASLPARSIVALANDLVLPSGDHDRGLGNGTVTFAPALLADVSRWGFVLQTEFQGVLPVDVQRAPRYFLYAFALQYPLGPLKSALVPSLEFQSAQKIEGAVHDY